MNADCTAILMNCGKVMRLISIQQEKEEGSSASNSEGSWDLAAVCRTIYMVAAQCAICGSERSAVGWQMTKGYAGKG